MATLVKMIRKICTMSALLLGCAAIPAMAQEAATVRTSRNDDYTRIVVELPKLSPYTVTREGMDLLVSFQEPQAATTLDPAALAGSPSVGGVSVQSAEGQPLRLRVSLKNDAPYRDLVIGNRMILDIFDRNGGAAAGALSPAAPSGPANASPETTAGAAGQGMIRPGRKPAAITAENPAGQTSSSPAPPAAGRADGDTREAAARNAAAMAAADAGEGGVPDGPVVSIADTEMPPPAAGLQKAPSTEDSGRRDSAPAASDPALDPYIVDIRLTENAGLAVFRREGWLWLVLDRPEAPVPPAVTGADPGLFPPFERVEAKNGSAYRVRLPEPYREMGVYVEGGGLSWRVVLSPRERNVVAVPPERHFSQETDMRGGTVSWSLTEPSSSVTKLVDPSIGDALEIVTVKKASAGYVPAQTMVDFDVLHSFAGLAVRPKADDLAVTVEKTGIGIGRPEGLALSLNRDVNRMLAQGIRPIQTAAGADAGDPTASGPAEDAARRDMTRFFDFTNWQAGGIRALEGNQQAILSSLGGKDKGVQAQDLVALAKMNLANGYSQEAIGFLRLAGSVYPDVEESIEFKALRGAALTLARRYNAAFDIMFSPEMEPYTELDYWRTAILAGLEDWQQAASRLPADLSLLQNYPSPLLEEIGLPVTEVALRDGNIIQAEQLLDTLQKKAAKTPAAQAGIAYLKGVSHNISGEFDAAHDLWVPLVTGPDDWYRVKAGLALTTLELSRKSISADQAIDRLEGLRYAWRGDELEARVNFLLGQLYLEKKLYLRGFNILRDAAALNPGSEISDEIMDAMRQSYKNILMSSSDLSPVDAVTIYEDFQELTPPGEEGEQLVQKLVERLVAADILPRAAKLLQGQVDFRLQGDRKAQAALRLASIYLLDRQPEAAMKALDTADPLIGADEDAENAQRRTEYNLLRAKALSQLNRTGEGLALLGGMEDTPQINRLRADLAWRAGLWPDAADALQLLLLDENIEAGKDLTAEQTELILNRAIALNLASDRAELGEMRSRYGDLMAKTPRGEVFDIVTRPRQISIMADAATISALVSEVDLFKSFLENYNRSNPPNSQ